MKIHSIYLWVQYKSDHLRLYGLNKKRVAVIN